MNRLKALKKRTKILTLARARADFYGVVFIEPAPLGFSAQIKGRHELSGVFLTIGDAEAWATAEIRRRYPAVKRPVILINPGIPD